MSILNDLSTLSTESRRIELAKVLAVGLIRTLLQKAAKATEEDKETRQTFDDGLEDSGELPLSVSTRVNSRLSSLTFTKPRQE